MDIGHNKPLDASGPSSGKSGVHRLHSNPDTTRFISEEDTAINWEFIPSEIVAEDIWDSSELPSNTPWSQSFSGLYGFDVNGVRNRETDQDHSSATMAIASFSPHSGKSGASSNTVSDGSTLSSQEDVEWQMYLSASLSNPFNSLAQNNPQGGLNFGDSMAQSSFSDLVDDHQFAASPISNRVSSDHDILPTSPSRTTADTVLSHNQSPQFLEASKGAVSNRYVSLSDVTGFASPHRLRSHVSRFAALSYSRAQSTPKPPDSELVCSHVLNDSLLHSDSHRPKASRGLSGWSADGTHLKALGSGADDMDRDSLAKSPHKFQPSTLDLTRADASRRKVVAVSRQVRKARHSSDTSVLDMSGSDDAQGDDDDDAYHPSRSPSESPESRPNSPFNVHISGAESTSGSEGKVNKTRRGKGKAKGSAALALAVVTQLSKMHAGSQALRTSGNDDDGQYDVLATARAGRKRKNNPIPLPVPVPHLIKKSRGRKVPYVAPTQETRNSVGESSNSGSNDEYASTRPVRGSRGRKSVASAYSLGEGGKRTYMCDVAGCGKCFVRGEHLKRHIRSIHTHDKPHPCPYKDCDKSFSRRDNLGQHVRIHLQAQA